MKYNVISFPHAVKTAFPEQSKGNTDKELLNWFLHKVAEENRLRFDGFKHLVSEFELTGKLPLGQQIISIAERKPGILSRNKFTKNIQSNLKSFTRIFSWEKEVV
jgi:hypothetical protein